MGQSRSDHDDQLPSDMTYHKAVYFKSFPSDNNCQVYFSLCYYVSEMMLVYLRHLFRSDFIIISRAGVGAQHRARDGCVVLLYTETSRSNRSL